MRILMVQGSSAWSGGEAVSKAIADHLKADTCAFVIPGVPSPETLERYQSHTVWHAEKAGMWAIFRATRRAILTFHPDVIHVHGTRAKLMLWPVLITLAHAPRVVYTVHGFHIIHRPSIARTVALALEKISNYWVDLVVSTTEADRAATVRWNTAPAKKTRAIHNGIDTAPFETAQGEQVRATLNLGTDPVAVIIARLHPQKDIETALVSWKAVRATLPQAHLLIVGDGPLKTTLEQRIHALAITNSVQLLGHRTDMPNIIAAANIVILPTHWEGMALAPLEAGAARKPIIATDIPGMKETVVDGVTGILVPEHDAHTLEAAILDLLHNPEKSTRMGAAGYERVVSMFSLSAMAHAYRDAYATPAKS